MSLIRRLWLFMVVLLFSRQNLASDNKNEEEEEPTYKNPLSKGFGDDIEWVKWDDAIEVAMERDKPIFLLIHKTWCHACKSLKLSFQQSSAQKALITLSKHFIMVNVEDDEEPWEEEYKPDGKYIPRILFLDKSGDVLAEFKNEKAAYENYKYYYSSPADVMSSMKRVMKHFGIEVPELTKKKAESIDKTKESKEDKKTSADDKLNKDKQYGNKKEL